MESNIHNTMNEEDLTREQRDSAVKLVPNRAGRKRFVKGMGMKPQHIGEVLPPFINPIVREHRIGRNEPCPCGAGRSVEDEFGILCNIPNKYKNCCLKSGRFENYTSK